MEQVLYIHSEKLDEGTVPKSKYVQWSFKACDRAKAKAPYKMTTIWICIVSVSIRCAPSIYKTIKIHKLSHQSRNLPFIVVLMSVNMWKDCVLKGPLTCLNYFWYIVEHEKLRHLIPILVWPHTRWGSTGSQKMYNFSVYVILPVLQLNYQSGLVT